jgi:hypothetical protein
MVFPILRLSAGVITSRIGDFGFRLELNRDKIKPLFRIPQSAFLNPQWSAPVFQDSSQSGSGPVDLVSNLCIRLPRLHQPLACR